MLNWFHELIETQKESHNDEKPTVMFKYMLVYILMLLPYAFLLALIIILFPIILVAFAVIIKHPFMEPVMYVFYYKIPHILLIITLIAKYRKFKRNRE